MADSKQNILNHFRIQNYIQTLKMNEINSLGNF
jgi:hypothetical protein